MRKVDSLEKTLMLGGIRGRKRRGQQRMRWLDGITDSMDISMGTPTRHKWRNPAGSDQDPVQPKIVTELKNCF